MDGSPLFQYVCVCECVCVCVYVCVCVLGVFLVLIVQELELVYQLGKKSAKN